jgi:hypothetical protein
MSGADLIELHIAFERPKSYAHMEKIAQRVRADLQRDLNRRFPKQLPSVYVADVRGEDDALEDD